MNFPVTRGDLNSLEDHEVRELITFSNVKVKNDESIDSKKETNLKFS